MRRIRSARPGTAGKIGTIGKVGCFSFQSYKLVNAGEGGILVTDDPEIAARASSCRAPTSTTGRSIPACRTAAAHWQNRLPLYNMRMQNLSAAVIRPQLPRCRAACATGRGNHDQVAGRLNASPWLERAAAARPGAARAGFDPVQPRRLRRDAEARAFQAPAQARGVAVQIFGLSDGQRPRLLELAVPGAAARPAQDPRHADARLRRAPARPPEPMTSWTSSPRRWSPRRLR